LYLWRAAQFKLQGKLTRQRLSGTSMFSTPSSSNDELVDFLVCACSRRAASLRAKLAAAMLKPHVRPAWQVAQERMSARTADAMRRVDRKFFVSRQDLGLPQAALPPLLSRLHPSDPAYLVCASRE